MKKLVLALVLGTVLLLSVGNLAMAAPGKVTDSGALNALAAARQATAKYHDVSVALADGYAPEGPCVEVPGLGVMGIHYVNVGLASDLVVDELTPEILLYVPTKDGVRLVGVEYFVASVGQAAPVLFGEEMEGPMPGHGPGQPDHFDLHVWLWQGNPRGIFDDFNPNLDCL